MRSKRRWMLAALFAAVAVIVSAGSALAAFWTDEGNYDTSWYDNAAAGVGDSIDNPYVISTARELAGLSYMMMKENIANFSGVNSHRFDKKFVVLGADIDLSAHEWRPIGSWVYTTAYAAPQMIHFSGTFDGQGHKITGLNIHTLVANAAPYGDCGVGLFAHPGNTTIAGSTAEIRNLYIEGEIVPTDTGKWSYAGLLAGSSIFAKYTNVVGSGTVQSNVGAGWTRTSDAGILVGTSRGETFKNCVVYGTTKAFAVTVGAISGRSGQNSGTTPYSEQEGGTQAFRSSYFNNVSLMTAVLGGSATNPTTVGSGIVAYAGTGVKEGKNNAFLANDENKLEKACFAGADQALKTDEEAKKIASESEVPVTAVLLDSDFLALEHAGGAPVKLSLAMYPKTSSAAAVSAEWKFDDADVKVTSEGGANYATSATGGEKKFSVVVKGLNGFGADDSVTLRGTMKFKEPEAPVVKDVEIVREDGETSTIENVDVTNIEKPADIAAIEGDDKPAEETTKLFAPTMNDGSAILSVSKVSVVTSFSMKFTYDDEKEPADLPVSITVSFTPDSALPIYIMAKGSDGYELFPATYSGGVVKAIIRNFRDLLAGGSLKAAADDAELELIVIQADVATSSDGTGSSNGGACDAGVGLAAAAALAAIALRKRGR